METLTPPTPPKIRIDPAFIRINPREPINLSASANFCGSFAWRSSTSTLPTPATGCCVTVAPLTTTTYTVTSHTIFGQIVSATVRVEVNGTDLTHIVTRTARQGLSDTAAFAHASPEQVATSATYFNGFGEAVQTVARKASPLGRDVISATEFDAFGRPRRQLLPFTAPAVSGTGTTSYNWYRGDYGTVQPAFYSALNDRVATDAAPYSTTWFEPGGPTGRPTVQAGPGAAWQPNAADNGATGGHPVRVRYGTNAAQQVRRFTYNFTTGRTEIATPAHYPAGTLSLTETADENGHPQRVFTDGEGHEVLRQAPLDSLHTAWASTYTVFDAFGRKRLVLPPMGTDEVASTGQLTAELVDRWAYRYEYDGRGRLTEKYLPGPVPTYYVYNSRDQLVLTGDTTGHWLFTKYDALGRPILTGEYVAGLGTPRATLQAAADAAAADALPLCEKPTGTAPHVDSPLIVGTLTYTLDQAYPTDVSEADLLTRTFYDRWDWEPVRAAGHRFAEEDVPATELDPDDASQPGFKLIRTALARRTLNLPTATQERVLGVPGTWLTTSTYYDERRRPIQTLTDLADADGQVAGTERSTQLLAWAGQVEQSITRHYAATSTPTDGSHYQRYAYDAGGRPKTVAHKLYRRGAGAGVLR